MDYPLKNTINKNEQNVIIEDKNPFAWIFKTLYLLLIAFGVILIVSVIFVKFHVIQRSKHYLQHSDDPTEEEIHKKTR